MKKKIIIINTHPIQYFTPLFKEISKDPAFDLEVWYCTKHGLSGEIDQQFGQSVKWDTPLLDGYKFRFFKNQSWKPGFYNGFFGVINLGIIKEIIKLRKETIIMIHGWYPFTMLFSILIGGILRKKIWLRSETPISLELSKGPLKRLIRKIMFKYFLFKLIDKFLFIGKQNKAFYKYFGVKDSKLFFTPYSVNNSYFKNKYEELCGETKNIKEKIKIPNEDKVILYSGKLIHKKRPLDLLKAFTKIVKENVYLIFVGDGELRSDMELFIGENNLGNKVLITGFINQFLISEYYSIADLYVMCSDYGETWGLSTNEAMNFELPVIVSDRTGNYEDLVKGNGFVFSACNVKELTEKLEYCLKMSDKDLVELGQKSKKIIESYSYQEIIYGLTMASKSH